MKRKSLVALILAVVLSTSMAFGLSGKKSIDAYYQNIKVYKDGSLLNTTQEPFIYNGTTYVPLRDVTESFGYDVKWNGVASSITLTSTGNISNTEVANLRYQLQQKQIEINTLKYEIDKLRKELKDDDKKDDDDDDDKDDEKYIKDEIEDEYEKYTKGEYTIKVKDVDVDIKSKTVEIEIKIDAERDKKEWEKRDSRDFKKYIEDICEMAAKRADKDVELVVKDDDNDTAAKYEYDEKDKDLDVKSEYDEDDDDDDDKDDDDYIKDEIKDNYDKYDNGSKDIDLSVKDVDVGSKKVEIELKMDVDKRDDEWDDRNKGDFRDLMEDIAKMAEKKTDKDIEIKVIDKDDDKVAEYEYDKDDKDLKKEYEYDK